MSGRKPSAAMRSVVASLYRRRKMMHDMREPIEIVHGQQRSAFGMPIRDVDAQTRAMIDEAVAAPARAVSAPCAEGRASTFRNGFLPSSATSTWIARGCTARKLRRRSSVALRRMANHDRRHPSERPPCRAGIVRRRAQASLPEDRSGPPGGHVPFIIPANRSVLRALSPRWRAMTAGEIMGDANPVHPSHADVLCIGGPLDGRRVKKVLLAPDGYRCREFWSRSLGEAGAGDGIVYVPSEMSSDAVVGLLARSGLLRR